MSQSHDQRSHGLATDTPNSLEYTEGQHTPSNYGTYGTMPPELLYASPSLIPNADFHTDEQNAIIHAGLGVSFSGVPWFQCYELQEYYSPPAGLPVYDEWDNYPADSRSMVDYMPMRSVLNYRVDNPPWGLHSIGFGDSSAAIPQSSRSSYTISSVVDVTPAVSPCIGPAMEEPPEREGSGDLAGQSSVVVPALQRAHLTRNAVGNSQNPPTPNLRRKSKIEKRLQESQNGGSHIVFDSVEGRNCSAPRARYSASRRKEVAEVRKRGACFKCKMWKRKVCVCPGCFLIEMYF